MRSRTQTRGFSLVELLVTLTIILILASLTSGGISAARSSQKTAATRTTITKIDQILSAQLERYASRAVNTSAPSTGMSRKDYRAWTIRRTMITGDMPDRWADVAFMAANPVIFSSPAQRTYIATWNSLSAAQKASVPQANNSAECLFMVIMQGGLADCLDCIGLKTADVGDTDGDGMMEFLDAWRNPIEFLLWAPALQLPAGSGTPFFSGHRSLDTAFNAAGSVRPTLGMRPLVYSPGPDGIGGLDRSGDGVTLSLGTGPVGRDCGNPDAAAVSSAGRPVPNTSAFLDNVTNLDEEAKR